MANGASNLRLLDHRAKTTIAVNLLSGLAAAVIALGAWWFAIGSTVAVHTEQIGQLIQMEKANAGQISTMRDRQSELRERIAIMGAQMHYLKHGP